MPAAIAEEVCDEGDARGRFRRAGVPGRPRDVLYANHPRRKHVNYSRCASRGRTARSELNEGNRASHRSGSHLCRRRRRRQTRTDTTMKKPVYVVDAMNYIFRAYHGLPGNITSRRGLLTNAVLGYLRTLLRIIN